MKSVIEKSLNFNKMIKVNFDGGNLTSDSGLLLYKEFTVRIKLIKIAGKVINTARYTTFKLCSSCLYKKHFWFALKKIQGIPLIE